MQALRHDEESPISAVDGYHAVEIAEACYESASTKEPVEIEADDDDDDALRTGTSAEEAAVRYYQA